MLDNIEDDEGSDEEVAMRRRSVRLFLANDEGGDEEEEESADEAPSEPEERHSGLVTLRVPQPSQNGRPTREHHVRPTRERHASVWNPNPPRETDLHMEDWEMNDGRVNKTGEGMSTAFFYPLRRIQAY